ncbi:MAG: hypothetical protein Q7S82_02545 [bacterium]|nr:hypothetical protein [bacterium]
MAEIFFLTSLIMSLVGISIFIFRKIPVLAELPQANSSRINTKDVIFGFIKTIKNRVPLKKFSGDLFLQKALSKTRVLIMKVDNKTFHWLQRLRENARKNKFGENDNYWKEIKGRASITELPKEAKVRKRISFSFDYRSESKNIRSSLPFVATRVGEEENKVLFAHRATQSGAKVKKRTKSSSPLKSLKIL